MRCSMSFKKLLSVAIALVWITGGIAPAQEAVIVREAAEQIFASATEQSAKELTEMGGRAAVETVLTRASEDGGEAIVKRAVAYTAEEGPITLRVLQQSPRRVLGLLDESAPEYRSGLLSVLERAPQALGPIESAGADGIRAVVTYPGTGEILVSKLGGEGAEATLKVSEDQAIVLARNADDIAGLPAAEKQSFWTAFKQGPGKVVETLDRSPNLLKAGVAVVGILAIQHAVQTGIEVNPMPMPQTMSGLLGTPNPKTGEGVIDRLFKPIAFSLAGVIVILGSVKALIWWKTAVPRKPV